MRPILDVARPTMNDLADLIEQRADRPTAGIPLSGNALPSLRDLCADKITRPALTRKASQDLRLYSAVQRGLGIQHEPVCFVGRDKLNTVIDEAIRDTAALIRHDFANTAVQQHVHGDAVRPDIIDTAAGTLIGTMSDRLKRSAALIGFTLDRQTRLSEALQAGQTSGRPSEAQLVAENALAEYYASGSAVHLNTSIRTGNNQIRSVALLQRCGNVIAKNEFSRIFVSQAEPDTKAKACALWSASPDCPDKPAYANWALTHATEPKTRAAAHAMLAWHDSGDVDEHCRAATRLGAPDFFMAHAQIVAGKLGIFDHITAGTRVFLLTDNTDLRSAALTMMRDRDASAEQICSALTALPLTKKQTFEALDLLFEQSYERHVALRCGMFMNDETDFAHQQMMLASIGFLEPIETHLAIVKSSVDPGLKAKARMQLGLLGQGDPHQQFDRALQDASDPRTKDAAKILAKASKRAIGPDYFHTAISVARYPEIRARLLLQNSAVLHGANAVAALQQAIGLARHDVTRSAIHVALARCGHDDPSEHFRTAISLLQNRPQAAELRRQAAEYSAYRAAHSNASPSDAELAAWIPANRAAVLQQWAVWESDPDTLESIWTEQIGATNAYASIKHVLADPLDARQAKRRRTESSLDLADLPGPS